MATRGYGILLESGASLLSESGAGSRLILEWPGAATSFDGIDPVAAVEAWWAGTPAMAALTADGRLWHRIAPENTALPYATVTLASESDETWTTAYPFKRASVRIDLHAATSQAARSAAIAVRAGLKGAPLVVAAVPVCHVLPDGDAIAIGTGLGPGGRDCWVAGETFDVCFTAAYTPRPIAPTFDGIDLISAVEAWWMATPAMTESTSDGRLWHLSAPENTALPYATQFLASESPETWTTDYPFSRSSLQLNIHAATSQAARSLAILVRDALAGAALSIDGSAVCHVLPDTDGIDVGSGLGPGGKDCWVAIEIFDVCFTPAS